MHAQLRLLAIAGLLGTSLLAGSESQAVALRAEDGRHEVPPADAFGVARPRRRKPHPASPRASSAISSGRPRTASSARPRPQRSRAAAIRSISQAIRSITASRRSSWNMMTAAIFARERCWRTAARSQRRRTVSPLAACCRTAPVSISTAVLIPIPSPSSARMPSAARCQVGATGVASKPAGLNIRE